MRTSLPGRPTVLVGLVTAAFAGCGGPLGLPVGDDTGAADAEPRLLDLGSLEGVITDAAGSPVEGAWVTTLPRGQSARTDAEGAWQIDLLPPDAYQLVVAAEGWQTWTSEPVEVVVREVEVVDLQLTQAAPPGGRIEVEVLGPDGEPLADAVLSASDGSSTTTDALGLAVLEGVVGEALTLSVQTADGRSWGRTLQAPLPVTAAGGLQWSTRLSGRPSAEATAIGAETCALCHPTVQDGWEHTAHASAMAEADGLPADLAARFESGETVDLGGATATLSTVGGAPQVTLVDSTGESRSYAVAGAIGSGGEATVPWTDLGEQGQPLPLGWRAPVADRGEWPGAAASLQPFQVERWFDGAGRFHGDAPDAADSAEARCLPCHTTGWTLAPRSDGGVDMQAALGSGRYNDPRVGCEQCHGPGNEHLAATSSTRHWTITQPQLLDPDRANEVCARCHGHTEGRGTGLPYPLSDEHGWAPPGDELATYADSTPQLWDGGAAAAPQGQHDELRLSPHGPDAGWTMRCTDCHALHGEATGDDGLPLAELLRLPGPDNSLCLSCHEGLSFDGDEAAITAHNQHAFYAPEGPTESGRCTGCHMAQTATDLSWSAESGAGNLSSHLFWPVSPQETVDAFDAEAAASLPLGSFPTHACVDCHAYNEWLFDGIFEGPVGDPTLRATHQAFLEAYEELYP